MLFNWSLAWIHYHILPLEKSLMNKKLSNTLNDSDDEVSDINFFVCGFL